MVTPEVAPILVLTGNLCPMSFTKGPEPHAFAPAEFDAQHSPHLNVDLLQLASWKVDLVTVSPNMKRLLECSFLCLCCPCLTLRPVSKSLHLDFSPFCNLFPHAIPPCSGLHAFRCERSPNVQGSDNPDDTILERLHRGPNVALQVNVKTQHSVVLGGVTRASTSAFFLTHWL